jgi:hypothetical protein
MDENIADSVSGITSEYVLFTVKDGEQVVTQIEEDA